MDEQSFAELAQEYGIDASDYDEPYIEDSGFVFSQAAMNSEYDEFDDLIDQIGDYMRIDID